MMFLFFIFVVCLHAFIVTFIYLQILKKIRPHLFAKLLSEGKLVRGGPEAVMEDRDVSMVPRAKLVRVMARLVGLYSTSS